jgi:hypothetical protein
MFPEKLGVEEGGGIKIWEIMGHLPSSCMKSWLARGSDPVSAQRCLVLPRCVYLQKGGLSEYDGRLTSAML